MKILVPVAGRCRSIAAAMVLVVLAACGKPVEPEDTSRASLTVTTTTLTRQPLDHALVVSGSVAAWQEMSLGVELSGIRVAEVHVEVGDRVQRGQVLLRLDARTLEVEARQADAALTRARADLALATADHQRGVALLSRRLISTSDADQLEAALRRAEAQLATAEADRDSAALRLGFATLSAPHAGIISARSIQPGQVVSSGAELLRLIRDGRLEWRGELAEQDLVRVRPGTPVTLAAADGNTVTGTVRTVAPSLDANTRTGLVYADLPPTPALRAGMFAEGRIVLDTRTGAVLPREAIVYRDGLPYVFLAVTPDADAPGDGLARIEQRRVAIGVQQGNVTGILDGIADSDQVVVSGAGFLSDGDLVRIVDAPPAAAPVGAAP